MFDKLNENKTNSIPYISQNYADSVLLKATLEKELAIFFSTAVCTTLCNRRNVYESALK